MFGKKSLPLVWKARQDQSEPLTIFLPNWYEARFVLKGIQKGQEQCTKN
jgi:hypothetical protein